MNADKYIEHEVQIRVHDERFKIIEAKLNWIITISVGGWILPIALHALKLV